VCPAQRRKACPERSRRGRQDGEQAKGFLRSWRLGAINCLEVVYSGVIEVIKLGAKWLARSDKIFAK
jgi:hypothetical protein